MKLFKNLFGNDEPITSYSAFWEWFQKYQKQFYDVVKQRGNIERDFFDKVTPKLAQLKEGLFLLCGPWDENTIELIITPDGDIKNIVFAEEIIAAAPEIAGWRFTALKPEAGEGFGLNMRNIEVSEDSLRFSSTEFWERPDEINIQIASSNLNEEDREAFSHAVFIFLDNYLGELSFATTVDGLTVVNADAASTEFRPIKELKPYLTKRQAEFVEKYDGSRFNTDEDAYTLMQAELESGDPLIAVVNTTLLTWDRKPSHPWIAEIHFEYSDSMNNGLPGDKTYQLLGDIEDQILSELKGSDGYLNIGRETAKNVRTVYFACREFRKPSKAFDRIHRKFSDTFKIDFNIYKDKYWQSFDRFIQTEGSDRPN